MQKGREKILNNFRSIEKKLVRKPLDFECTAPLIIQLQINSGPFWVSLFCAVERKN